MFSHFGRSVNTVETLIGIFSRDKAKHLCQPLLPLYEVNLDWHQQWPER